MALGFLSAAVRNEKKQTNKQTLPSIFVMWHKLYRHFLPKWHAITSHSLCPTHCNYKYVYSLFLLKLRRLIKKDWSGSFKRSIPDSCVCLSMPRSTKGLTLVTLISRLSHASRRPPTLSCSPEGHMTSEECSRWRRGARHRTAWQAMSESPVKTGYQSSHCTICFLENQRRRINLNLCKAILLFFF